MLKAVWFSYSCIQEFFPLQAHPCISFHDDILCGKLRLKSCGRVKCIIFGNDHSFSWSSGLTTRGIMQNFYVKEEVLRKP